MRTTILSPEAPTYPSALLELPAPPVLSIAGPLGQGLRVAIVGTREPTAWSLEFTRTLASAVASVGAVVISGGAVGVDAAAHEGALDAGGRTWSVLPTGEGRTFPRKHGNLYARIRHEGGALVWPFPR